jgi:hypothetical protein
MRRIDLLIIGAGPYGLSIASYAKAKELSFMIVGNSMNFLRDHMPRGMALRSPLSWHFDALGRFTFQRFVDETGRPVGLRPFFWFRQGRRAYRSDHCE